MESGRILIIDEKGFGRICSALAVQSGFQSDWAEDFLVSSSAPDLNSYDLVITSYPYAKHYLATVLEKGASLLVLADYVSDELIAKIEGVANCYWAIKPIDFSRFNALVTNILRKRVSK